LNSRAVVDPHKENRCVHGSHQIEEVLLRCPGFTDVAGQVSASVKRWW
jgi:hypothetical protein